MAAVLWTVAHGATPMMQHAHGDFERIAGEAIDDGFVVWHAHLEILGWEFVLPPVAGPSDDGTDATCLVVCRAADATVGETQFSVNVPSRAVVDVGWVALPTASKSPLTCESNITCSSFDRAGRTSPLRC